MGNIDKGNNIGANDILVPSDAEAGADEATSAAAGTVDKSPGILKALFFFLLPYLFNALITIGLIGGYHYFLAPQIVAMDIKGFVSEQRDQYIAGKIDSNQFRQNLDRMETLITGLRPNQVALMGDAVIRNVKVINVFEEPKDKERK